MISFNRLVGIIALVIMAFGMFALIGGDLPVSNGCFILGGILLLFSAYWMFIEIHEVITREDVVEED